MWQRLSLRARLNTLLALVMVLGLVINIARLLLEAAPRVAAEDQSVVRLARGFVETLVSDLNDASDPEARLDQIVEGLKQLRHVSITREHDPARSGAPGASAPTPAKGRVAAGSRNYCDPHSPESDDGRRADRRETGDPWDHSSLPRTRPDEIAEIWDGIVTQIEVGSADAAALLSDHDDGRQPRAGTDQVARTR